MKAVGHYSGLVEANGFIFCSGQVGIDEVTGHIAADVGRQVTLALQSLETLLSRRGLGLASVVKVTVYIVNDEDYDEMDKAYRDVFGSLAPARTTVVVRSLPKAPSEGPMPILFEVDAVAAS